MYKREFAYLQKQFSILMLGMLVGAVVLGVLTWQSCRTEYTDSLITVYAQSFPMFVYLIPFSMAFGLRPIYQVGISFGASRKGLFWSTQVLFVLNNLVGLLCAVGMNQLLLYLPQPSYEITVAYTLPLCVFCFFSLMLLVQMGMLFASFKINRWVFALLIGGSAGAVGVYMGFTAAGSDRLFGVFDLDQLFAKTAFADASYWAIIALFVCVSAVGGFVAYNRIQKEVAL